MWRYAAVLLVVVAAMALVVSGCGKKGPTEGTGVTVPAPLSTPAPTAAPAAEEITYQCPMHEDVTSDTPGRCTECGMSLVAQAPEGAEVEYVCSMPDMHPEDQVSDEPGKCPECGMFMAARTVGDGDGDDDDDEDDEDAEEDEDVE